MGKKKKREAKKTYKSEHPDDNLPQRSTKDIAKKHAEKEEQDPQERMGIKTLGTNEEGKELFDFVLKGMINPDKK